MTHSEHNKATIDAFNKADWDAYSDLVGDAVYVEPATGREVSRDAFIEALQAWRAPFPDMVGTITSQVEAGDTQVTEISWSGTHNGPLATPAGAPPPTGNSVTNPAAIVGQYDPDRLVRATHYFDVFAALKAPGAV